MKRLLYAAALAIFSFILTGCPYETEVPIDKPSIKFPANLYGKWQPKSSSDELMTIQKRDDFVVHITTTNKESKANAKPEEYEAFIAEVGGLQFLNLSEINEASAYKKYYLYKLEVSANELQITLSAVTENINEKFSSSAELKAFIEKNMHLSFFFEKDTEMYIRIK